MRGSEQSRSSGRTISINGTSQDLSLDRSWTVGDVGTDGSYANPAWITSLAFGKLTGRPTTLSGYGITDAVPYTGASQAVNLGSQSLSANTVTIGTITRCCTGSECLRKRIASSVRYSQTTIGFEVRGTNATSYWQIGAYLQSANQQVQLDATMAGTGQGRLNLGGGYLHVEGGPSSTGLRSFGNLTLSLRRLAAVGLWLSTGLSRERTCHDAKHSTHRQLFCTSMDNDRRRHRA